MSIESVIAQIQREGGTYSLEGHDERAHQATVKIDGAVHTAVYPGPETALIEAYKKVRRKPGADVPEAG